MGKKIIIFSIFILAIFFSLFMKKTAYTKRSGQYCSAKKVKCCEGCSVACRINEQAHCREGRIRYSYNPASPYCTCIKSSVCKCIKNRRNQSSSDYVPRGDYRRSCKNCYYKNKLLQCRCRKANGKWRNANLCTDKCNGNGYWNDNGNIKCITPANPSITIPCGGSYIKTCNQCKRSGDTINCKCKKRNQRMKSTSIRFTKCKSYSLGNIDGTLVCED